MRVGGWAKNVIKKLRRKKIWRGEVQWGSVRIKLKSEENRKDKRETERRRREEKEKRKKEIWKERSDNIKINSAVCYKHTNENEQKRGIFNITHLKLLEILKIFL